MSAPLRIEGPPGYGVVVPLDRRAHAERGPSGNAGYGWCRSQNAVFVNAAEFFKIAAELPIAFAREPRSGELLPLAVLGLAAGENLFIDDQGRWTGGAYVPASLRCYPFCVVEIPGGDAPRKLVGVAESGLLADSARPLFTRNGAPTPAWQPIQDLLNAMESSRQQTRSLTRRLDALDLLVAFDALVLPRSGQQRRLGGLYRVDEARLARVAEKQLRLMMERGELKAIYAHLLSLERFGHLLDRAQLPSARLNGGVLKPDPQRDESAAPSAAAAR